MFPKRLEANDVLIIDSHLDIAWNALGWNRDVERAAHTTRTMESRLSGAGRGRSTVGLPELRRGRVALSFATLLARATGQPAPNIDYASPRQAYAAARGQLAYYRALEEEGEARVITEPEGLERHISEWERWDTDAASDVDPASSPPLGFVISMEGVDPVLRPEQLDDWWKVGVRLLGLSHYGRCRYAGGTGTEDGLTGLGVALLPEIERLGIPLDLTHLSDRAFWEVLERHSGRVLASHNNCRALVPHQRQFSDEQLRAIIARDGVIGVALDNWMLKPGWVIGKSDPNHVHLENVVDQIVHICDLAGNTRHGAIGSDLDGGFGTEQTPCDLDTIADLQKLSGLLAARGFSAEDTAAILHGNWLRFLRESWTR